MKTIRITSKFFDLPVKPILSHTKFSPYWNPTLGHVSYLLNKVPANEEKPKYTNAKDTQLSALAVKLSFFVIKPLMCAHLAGHQQLQCWMKM